MISSLPYANTLMAECANLPIFAATRVRRSFAAIALEWVANLESPAMSTNKALSPPSVATQALKRRGLLIGAGAAGAAVLAVKGLPGAAPAEPVALATTATLDADAGYQLSRHVLRYYETTRI